MFKEVLTPLSVMKPMVRFKMTARLPAGVFVDSPGSDISTITLDSMSTISPGTCFEEGMIVDESMAGNSQKSVFQKTLDAVIDVWRNSQWIHLPVPHVVRSMERVIDFATSRHVPPNFRCFDVSYQKQLGNDAQIFLAMILVKLDIHQSEVTKCSVTPMKGILGAHIHWIGLHITFGFIILSQRILIATWDQTGIICMSVTNIFPCIWKTN